ncbi:MAG TPA: DEAD/DEAH box helicase, partial [Bacteroidales bacterium]|nr:DEAD/DEAH box helicase [Bacteroidales bacterium]
MIKEIITQQKQKLDDILSSNERALGEVIFLNGQCQLLSQSVSRCELFVSDENSNEIVEYALVFLADGTIVPHTGEDDSPLDWDHNSYACLLQIENELQWLDPKKHPEHKKYTRQGMINRVTKERRLKAEKAEYQIKWAGNIYGDHVLTNEKGIKYTVFLRDFENETGYSDSMDSRLNKLGTTKHIMYAFRILKENKTLFNKLDKVYPFIEIYCDPLNDYKITWFYPHALSIDEKLLITRYFRQSSSIEDERITELLPFIEEARKFSNICIRPEVIEKIEATFEQRMLEKIRQTHTADFSMIKAELYPYQKEGVEFALFRKNSIIADEMGLGKTIQAIATAVLKKEIFGFSKTLVVCPASLKEQWKCEIEKFSSEKALVVGGLPHERAKQYLDQDHFFFIINYETVLRDAIAINRAGMDFLILDEVQRAKNYKTKTANSLKRLETKHKLAITGTPIENRLIDIYSVMSILDPQFFGPLWEFSYQHCLFDPEKHNKINGYYNLQKLNRKLDEILIRREKRKVIEQLPNIRHITIPVELSPLQSELHGSFGRALSLILRKKYLTPYDLQRIQLLLANMRMVCDSTYLIDDKTNESPKLEELRHILLEKLGVPNKDVKIIIFSEWVKVHKLIGKLLRENEIGFVELNGKIPVKMRGELIRKFEDNPQYKIFLSTEAGGSGLNLQIADTLMNFELPWNPAKKNQRIGRIDRIGQKSSKLTIYNLITQNSIEQQIASGLLVKQSLFDGVLNQAEQREKAAQAEEADAPALQPTLSFAEEQSPVDELNLASDDAETHKDPPVETTEKAIPTPAAQTEDLEKVMNNGLMFLAGLMKMTTGKDIGMESQKIEINKETGEVTMKFKLPV